MFQAGVWRQCESKILPRIRLFSSGYLDDWSFSFVTAHVTTVKRNKTSNQMNHRLSKQLCPLLSCHMITIIIGLVAQVPPSYQLFQKQPKLLTWGVLNANNVSTHHDCKKALNLPTNASAGPWLTMAKDPTFWIMARNALCATWGAWKRWQGNTRGRLIHQVKDRLFRNFVCCEDWGICDRHWQCHE